MIRLISVRVTIYYIDTSELVGTACTEDSGSENPGNEDAAGADKNAGDKEDGGAEEDAGPRRTLAPRWTLAPSSCTPRSMATVF